MTRKPWIVFVEDDPDDRLLIQMSLDPVRERIELTFLEHGDEAIKFLRAGGRLPEVVVLDLKLFAIDGLEVLRRLRAEPRTRALPVVMFSSSIEPRDVAESYARGANSFVQKPLEPAGFARSVLGVAEYWLELNRCAL